MMAAIHGNSPYSLSPWLFPDILNSKPSGFLIPHLIGPWGGGGGVTGGPTGGGGFFVPVSNAGFPSSPS